MSERLRFGTAGLRAPLGEGPTRMNVQVVAQAATAIARWLPSASTVVIGRDARYGSADFASVTARILADAGHRPRMFDEPVPTPVVAWAVRHSDAEAGVMVTASHNPATDNGYKVYAADGGQILPPDAETIEDLMDDVPWPEDVDASMVLGVERLGDDVIDGYLAEIARPPVERGLRIVYTAMHGVGAELCTSVLRGAGHEVFSVPEQHDPDPDFPTAPFPNPEEPGALDLAFALAERRDADVILANDPDADRLAVALRRDGEWQRLTGDEIGVLLGWYLLGRTEGRRGVVTTIVSSSLLAKLAAAADVSAYTVLTGFKWLAKAADDHPDEQMILGYEEALGYGVNFEIRDKDGISAALVVAEMAAELAAAGRTLDDALDDIHAQHGVHVSSQVSKRFEGDDPMARMTDFMAELRGDPPSEFAGSSVLGVRDLIDGDELPPSDVLVYSLDGGRLIVRPSGTEPKVKAYLEAVAPDRAQAESRLAAYGAAADDLLSS